MSDTKTILALGGDGIGPEVMAEARKVLDAAAKKFGLSLSIEEDLVGGAAFDAHGSPAPDAMMTKAHAADAVLFGAVGGPKYDALPFADKPERGLLRLRKDLKLYANLRPAVVFEALADASALKPEIVSGLDILIVRELTGGVYFGEPRGVETMANGKRRGVNTHVYDEDEIIRVSRVAFDLAKIRGGAVSSSEKSNVMEAGQLWKEEVQKLRDAEYPDVELNHILADNCAMQLVKWPKQFNIILTDNLFGDMLSDLAAALTGSLGLLPSASRGDAGTEGRRPGLYEPVHGSAPDITGQGKANPSAMILSAAMMLRYSLNAVDAANAVEAAVNAVLAQGLRTPDIAKAGATTVSTTAMGDAIAAAV